mmetsp:Transcript_2588/g.4712  ORF Transcript_2588/g.4712 Transcript_2588/m.4712 type:complete len:1040 (+) Transcript_2588:154-3273(+)|eukprot:CAMPEP_0114418684 /NCGR_PEP_ID=MMETSP0103-20121206/3628_1 /TAXON_ID=37642 ORGANISM="Paraphysomonas imperforata, Strain PA2" /NCGR_SAMPLE_ID=MMETSP0103 /ASSEMBLY_ACC=CAM_ASM_000201 /LENGTH=1039 /DNA_ID=CAMNT_0001587059 /DNA_START=75 /DNA_END=3194 /DNA_ORIENTATION=+
MSSTEARNDSVEYEREALCLTEGDTPLQRFETFIEDQVGGTPIRPEDLHNDEISPGKTETVTENLMLRVSDEVRVTAALVDSSKKRKTGSVFSVEVNMVEGEMGLGVKILKNNVLVVSMLKRHNHMMGPGEAAGLRLGDIVFGANFKPCLEGVRSLLHAVKHSLRVAGVSKAAISKGGTGDEKFSKKGVVGKPVITLQCWRCHQLCSDPIPGRLFPRADDVFVQGYSLFRSRVLSEWERWNFNDILLGFLKKELKIRLEDEVKMRSSLGANPRIRVLHNEVLDLERNILKAKGLRTALCVRIVSSKFIDDAVLYVLRIEDEESGLQWNVRKRYNDFHALHKELQGLSKYLQDIPFPKKRIVTSRLSLRVIEERIVALEQFLRQAVHRLTQYSTSDAQASQSLRKVQEFLDVEMFIDCLKPPPLDDQRYLELMTYRRLNDFSSLSCKQCIRFVDNVDLDALAQNDKTNGYLPMLELVAQALREVEQYTIQQYGQQMNQILRDRRPAMPNDKVKTFVSKCVRRQVEGAIYLPLRRAIFRIVYSFIADKAERLQNAMKLLKNAPVKTFFEKGSYDNLHLVNALPLAVTAFRNLVNAYLPSDQGNMLMKAAGAVMDVISEVETIKKKGSSGNLVNELPPPPSSSGTAVTTGTSPTKGVEMKRKSFESTNSTSDRRGALSFIGRMGRGDSVDSNAAGAYSSDLLNKSVLADPAGTIFSSAEHILVKRRDFDHDGARSENITTSDDESHSDGTSSLVDDAVAGNESFRELYSILKAEERDSDDSTGAIKSMRDMAMAATGKEKKKNEKDRHEEQIDALLDKYSDRGSTGSPCSHSSDSGDELKEDQLRSKSPLFSDDLRGGDEDPGLPMTSSISQALCSSYTSSAIRGSSVMRLDGRDGPSLYRPSEQRRDTYMSPFRAKVDNQLTSQMSFSEDKSFDSSESQNSAKPVAVGADDFLPMFTYVLVQAELPQLLLVKELMITLVDNEEMYGECGYYMATLEAATEHIVQMGDEYATVMAHNKHVDNLVEKTSLSLPLRSAPNDSNL